MKIFIKCVVLIFILNIALASSQTIITSIKINPLNRALLLMNGNAGRFITELSQDKQSVVLTIFKSKLGGLVLPMKSDGIISDVSTISQTAEFIKLQFKLTDKRGYSSFYLPMSNSICLEVFDWAKLSQNEDNYRSALLALEDGLYSSAKDYLIQSANKDVPNAAGMLGVILLMEGSTEQALKYLHIASENNSNIPDAYAALSQFYGQQGNKPKADHYKKIFTELTGLNSFYPIKIGSLKPDSINYQKDSLSFLSYGVNNQPNQSAATATDTVKKIETAKKPIVSKANNDSSFMAYISNWVSPSLFYIVFGLSIFLLMLFSTYLKWRKKQIAMLSQLTNIAEPRPNQARARFNSELQKAEAKAPASNNMVINKYKANDNSAKPAETDKSKIFRSDYPEKSEQVQDLARIILENQKNQVTPTKNQLLPKKMEKSKNPNLDLALSLQKKQQKIKSQNIENMNSDELNSKDKNELSKKFGVAANTIDTKRKINDLKDNHEELAKLANKFRQK